MRLRALFQAARQTARDALWPNGEAAAGWIDGGWPKLVPCLLLPLAPPVLGSALRAVSGIGVGIGLALGTLITLALVRLHWPWIRDEARAWRWTRELSLELIALVPATYAVLSLYDPHFQGFPNLNGWDGGTHVQLRHDFVTNNPGAYHGFIAFHAVSHWVEAAFSLDTLRTFGLVFYLCVIAYAAFPILLAVVQARRDVGLGAVSAPLVVLTAAGVQLYLLGQVALPLLHYNQAMGYYPIVFGLLPLLLLWAVDVLVRAEWLRLLGIGLAVVMLRFTYGLNLPDVLMTSAGLLVLGTPRESRGLVQALGALGLGAAAIVAYPLLLPRLSIPGGITAFDHEGALAGHLVVAALLGVSLFLAFRARDGEAGGQASRLARGLRFPLLFVVVSGTAWLWLRAHTPPQPYYLIKYPYYATLLLVPACTLAVADAAGHAVRACRRWASTNPVHPVLRLACAALVLAAASSIWGPAYTPYDVSYQERRLAAGPPYRHLRPLANPEATARIQQTLAAEGKKFGGYLVSWFPMFNFMNAALGNHDYFFIQQERVKRYYQPRTEPGHCVFWVGPAEDTLPSGNTSLLGSFRGQVAQAPHFTCQSYAVPWKATPQSLCHRCY